MNATSGNLVSIGDDAENVMHSKSKGEEALA